MKTQAAIQSFLQNRRALNRRPMTLDWYEGKLNRFADLYPDLPTRPEPIEEFLASVVPHEKDETKHGYYRTLKAFYCFLCKRHRFSNPMVLIGPPSRRKKVRPTLTSQEMMQLLAQAQSLRGRAILSLFIDSGTRSGEAASLRKQHIFEDHIKVDGKTGEREIPISDETRRLLLALVACNGKSEFVFHGQRSPLTRSGMYQLVRRYMRKAGITGPKMGPTRIRHAFGKHYIKNGGDTCSLQKIMGHTNITTTEIYVELSPEEVVAKHHKYTPLTQLTSQLSFLDVDKAQVVKEAEEILAREGK
ncbi:Tyrosine recombinase XerC [subsurface metagenome]